MKLIAYAKLLNKRINSANNKAKNPFMTYDDPLNPFIKPLYNTFVWIENNENNEEKYKI